MKTLTLCENVELSVYLCIAVAEQQHLNIGVSLFQFDLYFGDTFAV